MEGIGKVGHNMMGSKIKYIDGFEAFHSKLKNNNVPTAIATNASKDTIRMLDKQLYLRKHFGKKTFTIHRMLAVFTNH
jgi:hypothetical protein